MGAERLERTRLHISQRTVTPVKKMPEVHRRPQVSHGAGRRVALLLEHVCKAVNVWSARAGTQSSECLLGRKVGLQHAVLLATIELVTAARTTTLMESRRP